MATPSYENALVAASDEMQKLLKQRSEIDTRIAQLKKTMEALTALMAPSPSESDAMTFYDELGMGAQLGISDAIRQVLRESKIPLSPTEIKAALANRGIDLSYANPGTVIHNTLNRLERQGELIRVQNPAGQTVSYSLVYPRTPDPIEDGLRQMTHKTDDRVNKLGEGMTFHKAPKPPLTAGEAKRIMEPYRPKK
jgi:hypothetical protein